MLEFFFVFGKMRTMHEKEAVNGMIYGIGLDVTELDRITSAYERRSDFAERVLTEAELKTLSALNRNRRFNDPGDFCEAAFHRFFPIYE